MKYYKDTNNQIRAICEDTDIGGNQLHLVKPEWIELSNEEVKSFLNPLPTDEELEQRWKSERSRLVDEIEVEYNGKIYHGDETSQTRMARALIGMEKEDRISWISKDGSASLLSKEDLYVVLRDAGKQQSGIWVRKTDTLL